MKMWAMLVLALAGSAGAARVLLDTRLSPQPTYASDSGSARVLRDTFAPQAVPGCRDTRVTDRTPGAFTRRGSRQVAYLVHACSSSYLIIYEGGRVIRKLTNIGDAIGNVGDINQDGTDELVLLAKYYGRGDNTVQDASLVTLAGNRFGTLFDLPGAAVNECSSADAYTDAYRVTVEPRARPLLTLEHYRGDCVAGFRLIDTRTQLANGQ